MTIFIAAAAKIRIKTHCRQNDEHGGNNHGGRKRNRNTDFDTEKTQKTQSYSKREIRVKINNYRRFVRAHAISKR